jgi:regulator of protease activity HflC (stomatin/prohibitin superfamily)
LRIRAPEGAAPARLVQPQIQNVARMVVSEYAVMDVYGKTRSGIQRQMFDRLRGMFAKDGIVLEDVLLRNVAFSQDFEKAVEAKMWPRGDLVTHNKTS